MSIKQAGVLLHPTSLPSGTLNHQAWQFLDWMESAHLKVWQMLPLTQPVQGLSPYQSVSAFAMNPTLLPEDWQAKWTSKQDTTFDEYLENEPHWLHDYALFMTLRQQFSQVSWVDWPKVYKTREAAALKAFAIEKSAEIRYLKQQQFMLSQIWHQLKSDANARGIQLFGDMPIFVAYDSADVWANPHLFKLDENHNPQVVTGVPPDYFSETGQRWGNPHYDWQAMEKTHFKWWRQRIASDFELFDLIRIDHFRGLEACWEIEAEEETAINGCWQKVPGRALLNTLKQAFPDLPLVAEDLGVITPEVTALKNDFSLPGMSILQFGFNGLPDNPHSLAEQVENSVVYTGTHDNDTTLGWWHLQENDDHRKWILSQLPEAHLPMPWPVIAAAMYSVAQLAIIPMQDFLGLDNTARMNVPGVANGNWTWQFQWSQMTPALTDQIAKLVIASGRDGSHETE
ncbi:4-alpha-glucanotransferase [Hydrogenovibrio sp. SC-1]|uniref:4-alpha-glucanotransferase n=1 Tax=Hydrogenovibrio sp. SC-1 TaxID=2065820 RepID=UPI000C7BB4A7|nr:4-alpha-glucanotransferase [Hydrogenovibrio sp. SC-1]PLA75437.1 4-alpha-glucanotransferase [Hydrogenovibrio sp. SC-1]